ncbi:MAG: competence protein CoiA family protein [Sphaerochaetaceae bacterium]
MLYALKNGKLTSINDVDAGLSCGCICPACHEKLIARKGKVRSYHFAHQSDSNCNAGYQTSLHLLAKEIISEDKKVFIPAVESRFTQKVEHDCILNYFYFVKEWKIVDAAVYYKSRTLECDSVELETKTEDIIPDLIVYYKNQPLIIEIQVTHAADDEKIEKIRLLGISAIEIDLSKEDRLLDKEQLKDLLLDEHTTRRWLYNKKEEAYDKEVNGLSIIASSVKLSIGLNLSHSFFFLMHKNFPFNVIKCTDPEALIGSGNGRYPQASESCYCCNNLCWFFNSSTQLSRGPLNLSFHVF